MSIGVIRGLITLVLLLAFLGLVLRLLTNGKRFYEEAARLPLEEDELHSRSERS